MEEDKLLVKTVKGGFTGLAAWTIWGRAVATWDNVPRVKRHVAPPGLVRTLKRFGSHGANFAAVGGLYICVEQVVQSQRKKPDFGAIGAFLSGAFVYGYREASWLVGGVDSPLMQWRAASAETPWRRGQGQGAAVREGAGEVEAHEGSGDPGLAAMGPSPLFSRVRP